VIFTHGDPDYLAGDAYSEHLLPFSKRFGWPVGLRCPHCGVPIEIGKDRIRAECPGCEAHVYRDGSVHPRCDCGRRHHSEQAIIICRAYRAFKAAITNPWEPAGTIEDNEWSRIVNWHDIRARVLARDDRTCTWPGCNLRSFVDDVIEVHHIIPRMANGSNDPRNLRCLCTMHHEAAHKLIGGGYQAYSEVAVALWTGSLPPEERAEIVAGTHPIVTKAREFLAIGRETNPRKRQTLLDLRDGSQRTLEVSP
jgi:hypothetical protein